jgi:hypothetical protein
VGGTAILNMFVQGREILSTVTSIS